MLVVENLNCLRGGRVVLERLSFQVHPGEIVALHGRNGSGKTTLLRTIAGLQPYEQGQITLPAHSTAYASHLDAVKDSLSVEENLMFWARIYGVNVYQSIYAQFDLTALKSRRAGDLSAGQKRRVSLARLAVTKRSILLLDEPTVSLDQASVDLLSKYLRHVHCANGGCALIASHLDLKAQERIIDLSAFKPSTPQMRLADEDFL